jgi:hypothetical protein
MAIDVMCIVCEIIFKPVSGNQLYCSPNCRTHDLTRECLRCKEKFIVSKRSRKTVYCSKSCAVSVNNEIGIMGKNAPMKKSKYRVDLTCTNCGNSFERIMSQVKKSQKKGTEMVFCNKECYSDHLSRNTVLKHCKECNESMPLNYKSKNKIFCSRACKDKHHRIDYNCRNCGKKGSRGKANVVNPDNLFCSRDCWRKYKLNSPTSLIANDNLTYISFRKQLTTLSAYKKWVEDVSERYGHRCAICNSDEGLEIHHIIPLYNIVQYVTNGTYTVETYKKILEEQSIFSVNNGIAFCKVHHKMCHNQ